MNYLTEDEIPEYCGLFSGVTIDHVEAASVLIDAYKGISFEPHKHIEKVDLNYKRSSQETRGKLEHFPRIEVISVMAKTQSPFGIERVELDTDCLEFDDDESYYFTFVMPRQLMFRSVPKSLMVTYVSGYAVPPEPIKRACGILAGNIQQMGGVLRWKSRDDYDIKVTLGNEGIFSSEVKAILRGVSVR